MIDWVLAVLSLYGVYRGYIWLKDKSVTQKTVSSKEARMEWAKLSKRVDRLVIANETGVWPARPSGLCKRWCPVGKRRCAHCGS